MAPTTTGHTLNTRQFVLRRLHSTAGLFPIGVFLFFHLGTNSLIASNTPGKDYFQIQVERIHALGPLLIPVEILFIFIPLAFHAIVGIKIWLESKPNASVYPYGSNIRFTLQRITGVIALVFILVHLWHMHWLGDWLPGGGRFDPENASFTAATAIQESRWWAVPLYSVGIVAACFHLANGLWTGLITWGVIIGPKSQRLWGYGCAIFGVALTLTGLVAINGFRTYDISGAPPAKVHSGTESDARLPGDTG